jgi:hypothetical protein
MFCKKKVGSQFNICSKVNQAVNINLKKKNTTRLILRRLLQKNTIEILS